MFYGNASKPYHLIFQMINNIKLEIWNACNENEFYLWEEQNAQ